MKAYYGSRISPNMTETPEGFLVCHNVPIARTGWYQYLGQELRLEDQYDATVPVYRSPEEVFSPAAMASFEGKSVTDDHPSNDVRPDNYASLEKGQVTNLRRGQNEESDLLLADLIIKDPVLISEIENGTKREVSCGYDCDYEPIGDDRYVQVQIRGNHVAVVKSGRAGDRVAIKDEKPNEKPKNERRKSMKLDNKNIFARMLSAFAKDAEPEELAEAAKMAPKEAKDEMPVSPVAPQPAPAPAPAPKVGDETPAVDPAVADLAKKIEALTAIVSKLVESDKEVHAQLKPENELDSLIMELETPEEHAKENEESVTVAPEKIASDEAPVASPEERPKNPIPGADTKAAILTAVRAIKPYIASIPDQAERKKASDALAKTFRDQIAKMPASPKAPTNGYEDILTAMTANAKAQDKNPETDPAEEGREWARKYNPHYKKEAK
ncbi:MAG TPA: hypothetical protein DCZ10_16135 [Pelotomaculum sp.]|nr:hypothetical protein [Pelotomaculum sp.]